MSKQQTTIKALKDGLQLEELAEILVKYSDQITEDQLPFLIQEHLTHKDTRERVSLKVWSALQMKMETAPAAPKDGWDYEA